MMAGRWWMAAAAAMVGSRGWITRHPQIKIIFFTAISVVDPDHFDLNPLREITEPDRIPP